MYWFLEPNLLVRCIAWCQSGWSSISRHYNAWFDSDNPRTSWKCLSVLPRHQEIQYPSHCSSESLLHNNPKSPNTHHSHKRIPVNDIPDVAHFNLQIRRPYFSYSTCHKFSEWLLWSREWEAVRDKYVPSRCYERSPVPQTADTINYPFRVLYNSGN